MRNLGVEEWLVASVMAMCEGARTVVRTVYGNSNSFEVRVGVHQGSALSPLLFVTMMEAISREFATGLPWKLLYADDLVVIAEDENELIIKLNQWKSCLQGKGLKVNVSKTKVMVSGGACNVIVMSGKYPCSGEGVGWVKLNNV